MNISLNLFFSKRLSIAIFFLLATCYTNRGIIPITITTKDRKSSAILVSFSNTETLLKRSELAQGRSSTWIDMLHEYPEKINVSWVNSLSNRKKRTFIMSPPPKAFRPGRDKILIELETETARISLVSRERMALGEVIAIIDPVVSQK